MKYRNTIIVLAVITALVLSPFIGIPGSWKDGIAILATLLIALLAYLSNRVDNSSQTASSPAENRPITPPSVN